VWNRFGLSKHFNHSRHPTMYKVVGRQRGKRTRYLGPRMCQHASRRRRICRNRCQLRTRLIGPFTSIGYSSWSISRGHNDSRKHVEGMWHRIRSWNGQPRRSTITHNGGIIGAVDGDIGRNTWQPGDVQRYQPARKDGHFGIRKLSRVEVRLVYFIPWWSPGRIQRWKPHMARWQKLCLCRGGEQHQSMSAVSAISSGSIHSASASPKSTDPRIFVQW
jgi:hypothetical protein